jgi:hypothetical protein
VKDWFQSLGFQILNLYRYKMESGLFVVDRAKLSDMQMTFEAWIKPEAGLYKLRMQLTHSLKPPGSNP